MHQPYLNQHWWTGREDQGGRDNCAEGTRQIDPVTSGEGGPCKSLICQCGISLPIAGN